MASLATIGQTHLGKSGNVKLSELNTTHAETRVYGTYGYKRVNSFEVARDHAPAPGDAQSTSVGNGAANSLAKWLNYDQWSGGVDGDDRGDDFDILNQGFDGVNCEQTASFSWQMDNYEDFTAAYVQQRIYMKSCTSTGCENCSDDPLDGTSKQDNIDTHSPGTWKIVDGITQYQWYVVGVKMEWNDEADGGTSYTQGSDSINYKTKATLTLNNANTCTNAIDSTAQNVIIFRAGADPTCTSQPIRATTSTDRCFACCAVQTTAYRDASGAFTVGTCYSGGQTVGCTKKCINPVSPYTEWKWVADNGPEEFSGQGQGTAYPVEAGCIDNTGTQSCTSCWC